jgi:hypothetical protein
VLVFHYLYTTLSYTQSHSIYCQYSVNEKNKSSVNGIFLNNPVNLLKAVYFVTISRIEAEIPFPISEWIFVEEIDSTF